MLILDNCEHLVDAGVGIVQDARQPIGVVQQQRQLVAEQGRLAAAGLAGHALDAALAMGFSRRQVFFSIELPQMLRFAVPGMVNEFTTVLKYSPFAYTVGLPEVTKEAMTLTATTLRGMEIYLAAGCLYFVIYRVLLIAVHAVERYFRVLGMEPT